MTSTPGCANVLGSVPQQALRSMTSRGFDSAGRRTMSIAPAIAHEIESRQESVRHFVDQEDLGALLIYSLPMANLWGQTGHVGYLSGWANHDRIV